MDFLPLYTWTFSWGRLDTCICMAESLPCSPEAITTSWIGYAPMQNVLGVKKKNLIKKLKKINMDPFSLVKTWHCTVLWKEHKAGSQEIWMNSGSCLCHCLVLGNAWYLPEHHFLLLLIGTKKSITQSVQYQLLL